MSEYQEPTSAISSLSPSTLFDLLCDPRRRQILAVLIAHRRTLTVNDLMKAVVTREQELPVTEIDGTELTQAHLELQHSHIPKLAETPLIEYDVERNLVEPTAQLEHLEPFLSIIDDEELVQP